LNDDDRYGLFLSFKVGSDKMIIAKDLPELQYRLVNPGLVSLSSKTELWIDYDAIDDESRPLADFFLTHSTRSPSASSCSSMSLTFQPCSTLCSEKSMGCCH